MKSHQQLFAEMKRRKVFQVAAVYGAVAFGLIQVADPLGEALRLPETFLPFVVAILLLGFPVALVLAWAFEVTPDGVHRTGAAAPGEIEAIVAEPASRRWPAGLLALAGAAALLGGVWWAGLQTGRADSGDRATAMKSDSLKLAYADVAEDARPSIAVLPFTDMSREGDQEYFSDGMTEELLNTLANIRELRVSGRTSTFAYKDQGEDLRTIGDELGVQYLVEGSVRKDGDELRITAQLIDASDGSHLWSDTYDRKLESVFAIQSEIATSIAEQLRVPLGLDDPSQLVDPVADLEAYDLYLAGRARMRTRGEALNEAVRLFEAAIERDSSWAPAWAGLAEATELRLWYSEAWKNGVRLDSATIKGELDASEEAARRALELDPRNPSASVALGSVLRDRFEWEAAEQWYRAALAIDPDNAEAHQQLGELLFATGQIARAVKAMDRAAVLDPAPIRLYQLGNTLELDDRQAEAIESYQLGIGLDPENHMWPLRRNLGGIYLGMGRYDEARRYWSGDRDDERRARNLRRIEVAEGGTLATVPDSTRRLLSPFDWLRLGEPDSAAATLAAVPEEGLEIVFNYVVWFPKFDTLRRHRIVRTAMREHGLANVTLERTSPAERKRPAALRTLAADAR